MRERIKDALVDEMQKIHGVTHEGWWTDALALNEVADAVVKVIEED
jgi:hypothetical protein